MLSPTKHGFPMLIVALLALISPAELFAESLTFHSGGAMIFFDRDENVFENSSLHSSDSLFGVRRKGARIWCRSMFEPDPELLDIAPRTIEQKFRSASKDDLRLMAQGLSGTGSQARSGSGQLRFTDLKVARLYGAPALLANARGKLELPDTVENMEAYYRYAVVVTRRGYWVNFCGGEPPAKVGETFQLFLEQLGVRD